MKFGTQFILTTLSKTTKQVSVFALSIILARYFTKTDYGTYLHVQLIANIAVWSLLMGIPHSIYYFLPKTYEKRRFVLTTLAIIISIAAAVSILILFNTDKLSGLLANPSLINLSVIMALLVFFQIPLSIFEPLMISSNKVGSFVKFDFTFNVAFFVVIVTPVALGYNVTEVLYSVVAFHCIQFLIIIAVILTTGLSFDNNKPIQDKNDEQALAIGTEKYKLKEQLKYSLPIGGSLSLAEVSRYADKIIVSNQFTPDDYAVYARGAMDIPAISIIANTLDNLLMPKFIDAYQKNDMPTLINTWHSAMRMMAAFIYPSCLFLIFVAPWLIPALFSEKYIASIAIFQIYTIGMLTKISTFNVIFRAIGQTQAMLWLAAGSLTCNIMLTYTLVQLWGVKGAALSILILCFLYFFASLMIITRYLGIKIRQVLPWSSLLATLTASTVSLIPLYFVSLIDLQVWIKIGVLAITFSLSYISLFRISPALNFEEKESVRNLMPNKLKWVI